LSISVENGDVSSHFPLQTGEANVHPARIHINARTVTRLLTAAAAILLVTHLAIQTVFFVFGIDYVRGLPQLFNLNRSSNLIAWYSGLVCLAIALGLALIAAAKYQARDGYRHHWTIVAIAFLGVAVDEVARLHEHWRVVVGQNHSPLFRTLSAVVAGAFFLLVALGCARFLQHLPRQTRHLFAISGAAYLAAAIGLDAIADRGGNATYTPVSMILGTLEEAIEIGSYVVFLYALLTYAERTFGEIRMSFKRGNAER
jgi:hypothetical protein